jgi:L-threonylcarbamoyladenylate synthase
MTDMENNFEKDITEAIAVLRNGGLILYPTDTVWGIGCDATSAEAVKKIFSLKQRAREKSMIALVADQRDILRFIANPDPAIFEYLEQITKPTTVIYPGAIGLAENLVAGDGSIAIRIVEDEFCKHLIKRFRKPIVSTSANFSGEEAPKFFADIRPEIKQGVDYVVHHRQDDLTPAQPSAVVKWKSGVVTVIRP